MGDPCHVIENRKRVDKREIRVKRERDAKR